MTLKKRSYQLNKQKKHCSKKCLYLQIQLCENLRIKVERAHTEAIEKLYHSNRPFDILQTFEIGFFQKDPYKHVP